MLKFIDKTGKTVATLSDEDTQPQFNKIIEEKQNDEVLGHGETDTPSTEEDGTSNSKVQQV